MAFSSAVERLESLNFIVSGIEALDDLASKYVHKGLEKIQTRQD